MNYRPESCCSWQQQLTSKRSVGVPQTFAPSARIRPIHSGTEGRFKASHNACRLRLCTEALQEFEAERASWPGAPDGTQREFVESSAAGRRARYCPLRESRTLTICDSVHAQTAGLSDVGVERVVRVVVTVKLGLPRPSTRDCQPTC